MMDYDLLSSPFELPVNILLIQCNSEYPLIFSSHEGATPGTTLNGALGEALLEVGCTIASEEGNHCIEDHKGLLLCKHPKQCPVPKIYKPFSEVQRRSFPRPIRLRYVESRPPTKKFSLITILWGQKANMNIKIIQNALHHMGKKGLYLKERFIPFKIEVIKSVFAGTLKDYIYQKFPEPQDINSMLLEFTTPFYYERKIEKTRWILGGGELPLGKILGNVAYELTSWHLEDLELFDEKQTRDNLAQASREYVESAAGEISVEKSFLIPINYGKRYSRRNKKSFYLQGVVGYTIICGNISKILPWLVTLSLWGGGQKKSYGSGDVKLWIDPDSFFEPSPNTDHRDMAKDVYLFPHQ
jgi:hypothetical protein